MDICKDQHYTLYCKTQEFELKEALKWMDNGSQSYLTRSGGLRKCLMSGKDIL